MIYFSIFELRKKNKINVYLIKYCEYRDFHFNLLRMKHNFNNSSSAYCMCVINF